MYKVYQASPEEWDRFVNNTGQKSIYSLSQYNQFSKTPSQYWISTYQGNNCLGMIVADNQLHPNYSMYQGIFIDKKVFELKGFDEVICKCAYIVLRKALEACEKIELSLHPSLTDIRFLSENDINVIEKKNIRRIIQLNYTGIIELDQCDDFNEYLSLIRKCRKQEYRRCLKNELVVEDNGKVEEFDMLHSLTFSRQELSRSKKEENAIINIVNGLVNKKLGTIFIVRNKETGEPMSSVVFSYLNNMAYYQFGATNPKFRKDGVSTFVILEAIRKVWSNGCRAIDMVGINSPNRGDFKTSLNSKPKPYFTCTFQLGD